MAGRSRATAADRRRVGVLLRQYLGQSAPAELIAECAPELARRIQAGRRAPAVADLLVNKLVRFALDPKKANEWACKLILEYNEGRAPVGLLDTDDGRDLERSLQAIDAEHLNAIAEAVRKAAATATPNPAATDLAPGLPVAEVGDVPEDGDRDTQDAAGKHPVATATPGKGPGRPGNPGRARGGVQDKLQVLRERLRMDTATEADPSDG